MLGIVLCGGQSLRMGADKGLLIHDQKPWARLAKEKLVLLGIPVKCVINVTQLPRYTPHFQQEELILDQETLEVKGPLLGTLSAHIANPESDLFVLACDLVSMQAKLMDTVLKTYRCNEGVFEAYIFVNEAQQEPLCGIYTAAGLKKINAIRHANGLARHSMKYVLSQLNVCEIPVDAQDVHCFRNFNSPGELDAV